MTPLTPFHVRERLARFAAQLHARRRLGAPLGLLRRLRAFTKPIEEAPVLSRPVHHEDGGWTFEGTRVHPDDAYAWRPDRGQHDMAKRHLRIALWRFANDPEGRTVDLQACGLSRDPAREYVGPLLPVSPDLAATCQRLGFARLAEAAWPRDEREGKYEKTILAAEFHAANEEAARAEAARRFTVNTRNANDPEVWDPRRGPMVFDSVAETIALLTLGDYDGPTLPEGKTLEPLLPFQPLS